MDLETGRSELGAMGESLQPQTPSRHEKSLGLLTTKFVTLLQEAKDGVLDLKAVSTRRAHHYNPHHHPLYVFCIARAMRETDSACCKCIVFNVCVLTDALQVV